MSATTPRTPATPAAARPTAGLRERKKARTRWAIQEHALRLFAEQGYENTTVDQIAAAAEISPSTFFRYFATKEDVVVQDEFDEQVVDVFRAAGASPHPFEVLREAMVTALVGIDQEELLNSRQRMSLISASPALRARTVENVLSGFGAACEAFAEGAGRPADDPAVPAFVGAVMGSLIAVFSRWADAGYAEDVDELFERTLTGLKEIVSPR